MNNDPPNSFPVEVHRRLSSKIIALLLLFFVAAVVAIGTTLYVSWQLEGGAAAINDAGRQRMRSYRLGLLAASGVAELPAEGSVVAEMRSEMAEFDRVMRYLAQGDIDRRIATPHNPEIVSQIEAVRHDWQENGLSTLNAYLQAGDAAGRQAAFVRYRQWLSGFVAEIDGLVLRMEHDNTFATNLLRSAQVVLLVLALLGTAVLIRFFFVLVIRPLDQLYDGMRDLAGDNFSVRLKAESDDEFGVVANGFNRMVAHLQKLYSGLEEMVAAKTSSLAERNQELGLLYGVAAFLNEPASIEILCQGFLQRVKAATGAAAGAVRLCSGGDGEMFLIAHDGLSQRFVACEQAIRDSECACGEALTTGIPLVVDTAGASPLMTRSTCAQEGMRTVSAFTISHNKEVLGVFNLYFPGERSFSPSESCLLETLGQHLGMAVENQRLRSRDRELAISEERNLLAQELHDSIAQGLAFLNIQAQLLQDSLDHGRIDELQATVGQIREGVLESYDDVRELLVHFRTRVGYGDLNAAILSSLERFEQQTGIATAFNATGKRPPLAPDEQVQVVHIVQESLSNVRKHAQASRVEISVNNGVDGTEIEIADDGIGFDPALVSEEGNRHIGLKIMQERTRKVGGQCIVQSAPGEGTRVVLTL